jgi:putative addiction module component (TIGR02574 family)
MNVATALKEIEGWSLDDQIDLAQQLWDRLWIQAGSPGLTDDQKAELDRLLEALKAKPDDVLGWESIVEHMKRKRAISPTPR